MAPKATSSVHDLQEDKPSFGSRFLTDEADVWSQNAWDHVPPPDDQAEAIATSLAKQRSAPVPDEDKQKYNATPARHWDNFYKANASNFFKDRKWLHLEFPELVQAAQSSAGPKTIVEIGCGAGNSVFPLLAENTNPELTIHAYDYSSHAVKLVQTNPLYLSPPCGTMHSAVWDLSSASLPDGLEPGTADIVVLVFVLSALHPDEWPQAVSNIHKILKPGGHIFLRDYGRYDLTQLRFKTGRLLDDNFYIRGDKTRVYFFDQDELSLLFTGSKAPSQPIQTTTHVIDDPPAGASPTTSTEPPPVFYSPSSPTPSTSAVATGEVSLAPISDPQTPSSSLPTVPAELEDAIEAGAGEPELPTSPRTTTSTIMTAATSITDTPESIHPSLLNPDYNAPPGCPAHPLFAISQLGVDRRLIVNRKRQLKMYRVWMQGKFRKL